MCNTFTSVFRGMIKQKVGSFEVLIKLNNKEASERLDKIRWRIKCAKTKSLVVLYTTKEGSLLQQALLSIDQEIRSSITMLKKQEVSVLRFLAEQVLALEALMPHVMEHLRDICNSDEEHALSRECLDETRGLQILVDERVEGLRKMQKMFAAHVVKMGRTVWTWECCRCAKRVQRFKGWIMGEASEEERQRNEEERRKLLNAKIVKFRPFY